jgi:DNA-binding MarR family transcriptional regulator
MKSIPVRPPATASTPNRVSALRSRYVSGIYDLATYEPRKALGHLISQVRAGLLAALDQEFAVDARLAELELSGAQFVILATLAVADQAACATALCQRLSYDPGGMTRILDRLESKGLVHRYRSAADRRRVDVELTEEGRAAFPRMREISMDVLNGFLRGFTKTEARQFESYLKRMLQNAQSAGASRALA